MFLVIREAFINLRLRQIGETVGNEAVNALAVREQPDDIMHADACAFNPRIAAANRRCALKVSVIFCDRGHALDYITPFKTFKPRHKRWPRANHPLRGRNNPPESAPPSCRRSTIPAAIPPDNAGRECTASHGRYSDPW